MTKEAARTPEIGRRHDLDALRANAMLLGIALHGCLSFAPFPWFVQDAEQSLGFLLFFTVVHGFRMQLFFLVSGFFTAMLWRRRGLKALVQHRAQRILLPCLLGVLTIVPALDWTSDWALESAAGSPPPPVVGEGPLIAAIRRGDPKAAADLLADGADPNATDSTFRLSALGWAATRGDAATAQRLLDTGAKIHARAGDGATPLHNAAFLGRSDVARLLLSRGANPEFRNNKGQRALEATHVDWRLTRFIGGLLRAPLDQEEIRVGRIAIRALLEQHEPSREQTQQAAAAVNDLPAQYMALISSRALSVPWPGLEERLSLTHTPFFHHLWFLWFLCWLVGLFVLYATLVESTGWRGPRGWLFASPWCLSYLIPLTILPQWLMGEVFATFGPDTSVGLLPQPHVLAYYGIFFGFGVLYYDVDDRAGFLTKGWPWMLLIAIFVAYPAGLIAIRYRPVGAPAQAVYAWLMTLGLMGLFRSMMQGERPMMRYLSDASYWLYLAHVPLVIVVQQWIRDWPFNVLLKFVFVVAIVTGLLLIIYQWCVRYTWIGRMLNGPRARPAKVSSSASE